jgi:hypothetical protein
MNGPYPTLVRLSQFLSFLGLVRGSSRTCPVRAETAASYHHGRPCSYPGTGGCFRGTAGPWPGAG